LRQLGHAGIPSGREIRNTWIWRFAPDGPVSRWDGFNQDDAAEAAFLADSAVQAAGS
jgi:hypothetical protein